MSDHDTPDPRNLGMEPEDLDGHTIEELSDYLDRGRIPADASIDQSPGCLIALEALERLRALSPALLAADTAAEPPAEESWVQGILAGIALDARAGRRIPIVASALDADLGITEGAVRGVVRAAEASVPGVVVGACRFEGDVTVVGEPVRILVEVSVIVDVDDRAGRSIPDLVDALRREIGVRIAAHTTLNVVGIDVSVQDIQGLPTRTEER